MQLLQNIRILPCHTSATFQMISCITRPLLNLQDPAYPAHKQLTRHTPLGGGFLYCKQVPFERYFSSIYSKALSTTNNHKKRTEKPPRFDGPVTFPFQKNKRSIWYPKLQKRSSSILKKSKPNNTNHPGGHARNAQKNRRCTSCMKVGPESFVTSWQIL